MSQGTALKKTKMENSPWAWNRNSNINKVQKIDLPFQTLNKSLLSLFV